jgi:pimeloyl-ACP methyl ester carboxylesterase
VGPVLLIPGVTGIGPLAVPALGGTYWRGWKSALANQGFATTFKVSQPPGGDIDACVQAAEPTLVNNASLTNKAHLIGHSRGGLVARRLAKLHPDLVRSVTCVATPHRGQLLMDLYQDLNVYGNAVDVVIPGPNMFSTNGPVQQMLHSMSQALLTSTNVNALAQFNLDNPDQVGVAYADVIGVLAQRTPSLSVLLVSKLSELADPGVNNLPVDVQQVVTAWHSAQQVAYGVSPVDILYGANGDRRGHDGGVVAECARSPGANLHVELATHLDHMEQVGLDIWSDPGSLARRVARRVLKPAELSANFPP